MKKFTYWLRWVTVLPGAIIIGLLATFPLHWILQFAFAHDGATLFGFIEFPNGLNINSIEYLLSPCIIAIFYIIAGSNIAPKYKFKTAVVLFGIYLIAWIIISAMALSGGGNTNLQFSGRTILAALGALAGLVEVKMTNKEIRG